jgi:hypothetical protein
LAARRRGDRPLPAAGLSLGLSVAVFSLVNYPMFFAPGTFRAGLSFELHHIATGHGSLVISPLEWGFAFHLLYSLLPGLTLPVALLALAALVAHLLGWRRVSSEDRLWVLTALLFYFSAELSPTKPPPDFMRYMLPVVPSLALLAVGGVGRAVRAQRGLGWLGGLALAGAVGWSAVTSVRLVAGMSQDTRAVAARWLDDKGELWKGERFTPAAEPMPPLPWSTLRPSGRGHPPPGGKQLMHETLSLVCNPGRSEQRGSTTRATVDSSATHTLKSDLFTGASPSPTR